MKISLSEVMNVRSEAQRIEVPIEAENISYMGDEYPVVGKEPVLLELVSDASDTLRLKAHIVTELSVPCSRCLEPVTVPFDIDADYEYVFGEDGSARIREDEEQVSYIDGYELDVDALVGEEVMIGFPMKVLCSPDCKGICAVCGANLNRGECGCDRTVLDPRMSIIRDLFRQKEV